MAKRCASLAAGDIEVLVAEIFEDGAGDLRSDCAGRRDNGGELYAFGRGGDLEIELLVIDVEC